MHQESDAALLEESLSYATNEGAGSESELDLVSLPNTPTNGPYLSSVSSTSSFSLADLNGTTDAPFHFTERKVYIELSKTDEIENTPFDLMQTGNEMLKGCSLKNVVEEQIRAVPK